MRTETIRIYKFQELSDKAKEKAIEKLRYINVEHDWWDSIYYDAKEIGLKITGFEIDRGSYCNGKFILSACEVADKIKDNHGEECETYKTASRFLCEWNELVEKHSDGINTDIVTDDNSDQFDAEANELEQEFLDSLCEDYRIILQKEYEWLTDDEAIIETIEANEYEFTEEGDIY